MPLARHDDKFAYIGITVPDISTHMPLARHDEWEKMRIRFTKHFYSHASCEA